MRFPTFLSVRFYATYIMLVRAGFSLVKPAETADTYLLLETGLGFVSIRKLGELFTVLDLRAGLDAVAALEGMSFLA